MEKIKGGVGILFVRDVDRGLMAEVRALAVLRDLPMRMAVEDALRDYVNKLAPWGQKEGE
jgi:hypothetical protein